MTIPTDRQCCLPTCGNEAIDPTRDGALCESHIGGDDTTKFVSESDESDDKDTDDSITQITDTGASTRAWEAIDFAASEPEVWPPELLESE